MLVFSQKTQCADKETRKKFTHEKKHTEILCREEQENEIDSIFGLWRNSYYKIDLNAIKPTQTKPSSKLFLDAQY